MAAKPGKGPARKATGKKPTRKVAGKKVGKKPPRPKNLAAPVRGARKKTSRKKVGAKKSVGRKGAGSRPVTRKVDGSRRPAGKKVQGLTVTPEAVDLPVDSHVRLNKFVAAAGLCSRRTADEWIKAGRIQVNDETCRELGTRVDPDNDVVSFEGRRIEREKPTYVLFNKPRGVLCTNARNEPRRRVMDFLEDVRGRLYTVGRLDADSEGLILVTNDGDFAQAVAHPRHGVPKTYSVLVRGRVTAEDMDKARGGVWLAEGRTGGARIKVEKRSRDKTYLKVQIREGRNREIRRVFARLGYAVKQLKRIRIGELSLHGLKPGKFRFLTRGEIQELLELAMKSDDQIQWGS